MDRIHEKSGLSTPERSVMRLLSQGRSATVPDIAAEKGKSRQFIQVVFNDLFSRGYLVHMENPRHKRSKRAELTESGYQVFSRSQEKEKRIIEQALSDIDPARAEEACQLLEAVRKAVEMASGRLPLSHG